MEKAAVKQCKECLALPEEERPKKPRPLARHKKTGVLFPGPRCTTHQRLKAAADRARLHENRVVKVYGLSAGDYDRLYKLQNGTCYICQRATGATKKLSVDHNHETGEVRGLLCGPCNKNVIGHLRHDVEALRRAIEYLENPPARGLAFAA